MLIFPGAVVKGSGPKVYVIENNQRRWIPDPPTLIQNYGGWPAVRDVSDEDLLALTEGPQIPSVINPSTLRVENMHSKMNNSGSRYMITSVTLTKDGKVLGNTYTRNDVLFAGYHGRVDVVFKDASANTRHSVSAGPYGVGAKAFEKYQVWANWEGTVPADILPDIVAMEIVHSWDPNYSAVRRAIDQAVQFTQSIVKLGENIGKIGAFFAKPGNPAPPPA